ncbi:NAD-dependent epimerase/dehydratase family protein [Hyphobacterium marinum]|uniref:NAD-dependent epimerase/dehydratase family protein n=1 Tax=Hyphobacterium marinum TaxID=3116574 RepID=A0ABU7LUU7_9PROT|nr:NAD-dependent epimerase/dehydratase family protein [Hyphobacterium sp. Y6023]MEE2565261.1 NAD-dependent epimerase/dehydratase family protein [Hyphobacterium sp. Y6023]
MTQHSHVLVTGASGFIALHCLAQLLTAGHRVRGTLRSPKREEEVRRALTAAGCDVSSLDFVHCDLMEDAGWDEAVAGCDYVLHVASPFPAVQPKDENELIIPAREGALRVLRAAAKAGVKRTVMTSSVAAVSAGHDKSGGRVFNEDDWSDLDGPGVSPYEKSKTIAERAAWDFMATPDAGAMELAVINPGAVLGPILSPDSGTSVEIVRRLMARDMPAVPRIGFVVVDVRDVAAAHIAAMTAPGAADKRYICALPQAWFSDVAAILDRHFGPRGFKIPTKQLPDWVVRLIAVFDPVIRGITPLLGVERKIDNSRTLADLGWQPRDLDTMVVDCGESLITQGVIKTP